MTGHNSTRPAARALSLGQLEVTPVDVAIRVAQNVQQPRPGGYQQPARSLLRGGGDRGPPGLPALRRRGSYPALRLGACPRPDEGAVVEPAEDIRTRPNRPGWLAAQREAAPA